MVVLCSSSVILDYDLRISHQCGKKVKTKSQNVFGVNSYICWKYRGKAGKGVLFAPPPPSLCLVFWKGFRLSKRFRDKFCITVLLGKYRSGKKTKTNTNVILIQTYILLLPFKTHFNMIWIFYCIKIISQKMFSRGGNVL